MKECEKAILPPNLIDIAKEYRELKKKVEYWKQLIDTFDFSDWTVEREEYFNQLHEEKKNVEMKYDAIAHYIVDKVIEQLNLPEEKEA